MGDGGVAADELREGSKFMLAVIRVDYQSKQRFEEQIKANMRSLTAGQDAKVERVRAETAIRLAEARNAPLSSDGVSRCSSCIALTEWWWQWFEC
jgi:hypothetical protein